MLMSLPSAGLKDSYGRTIGDLRISITDRCNFACLYCMPEKVPHLARQEILTFEEIERLARLFLNLGVRKIRLTGGEPLARHGVVELVERLSALKAQGLADLAMTTNGYLLPRLVGALRRAGLDRLNLSCDSLDRENFLRITRRDGLPRLLTAIRAAEEAGFSPLKINCVVVRGLNDHEVADFARFALDTGHIVRFIEFMPLDSGQAWGRERLFSGREILERLRSRFRVEEIPARHPAETARRYLVEGRAEVGIIASVTSPFCGRCNRLRLTAEGYLRTCLFAHQETDLKTPLRAGASDADLAALAAAAVGAKEAGHRINEPDFVQPARSMVCIGG